LIEQSRYKRFKNSSPSSLYTYLNIIDFFGILSRFCLISPRGSLHPHRDLCLCIGTHHITKDISTALACDCKGRILLQYTWHNVSQQNRVRYRMCNSSWQNRASDSKLTRHGPHLAFAAMQPWQLSVGICWAYKF